MIGQPIVPLATRSAKTSCQSERSLTQSKTLNGSNCRRATSRSWVAPSGSSRPTYAILVWAFECPLAPKPVTSMCLGLRNKGVDEPVVQGPSMCRCKLSADRRTHELSVPVKSVMKSQLAEAFGTPNWNLSDPPRRLARHCGGRRSAGRCRRLLPCDGVSSLDQKEIRSSQGKAWREGRKLDCG